MRILNSLEEFTVALNEQKVLPPDTMVTEAYQDLSFECGCGQSHGVNESIIEKISCFLPNKFLFKCPTYCTKVHMHVK